VGWSDWTEVRARRREDLTGEESDDGDQAPAKDWRRGGVVELQRGAVKLSRWSSGTMGGLEVGAPRRPGARWRRRRRRRWCSGLWAIGEQKSEWNGKRGS
jgi:hypothetical protein